MNNKEILIGGDRKYTVNYSPEIAMQCLDKIIEWMENKKHYTSHSGEGIMQSDDTIIDAPELISDIVDDVLKPVSLEEE